MKPSMELRHLRYFVAVAEELNITRAAQRLHTAQPSLSRQIRQLEEFMRAPLLLRHGHQVGLTDAGRKLLTETRRILLDIDSTIEAIRETASAEAGKLIVGFFPGSEGKVFSRLMSFLKHKSGGLQLEVRSLTSAEQIGALQDRAIHAGFLVGPIADSQIAWKVVCSDPVVVVLPAGHQLAKLKRVPLKKLAGMPFIEASKRETRAFFDTVNSLAAAQGVVFHTALKTDNMRETLSAVGAGLGFCFYPDSVAQMAPRSVVTRPLTEDSVPTVDLLVAYRRDNRSASLATFLSLVSECFSKELAWRAAANPDLLTQPGLATSP
jgi:LysR family hca operon transcriptional activator